jgi:hypothetical protein
MTTTTAGHSFPPTTLTHVPRKHKDQQFDPLEQQQQDTGHKTLFPPYFPFFLVQESDK